MNIIVKQGDTIPVVGAIQVLEDGIDVTEDVDFSLWGVSFAIREFNGEYEYEVQLPLQPDGTFSDEVSSAETATMPVTTALIYDIRIRDESDVVVSTRTGGISVVPPVAGVPE